jgi:hypothetical protein
MLLAWTAHYRWLLWCSNQHQTFVFSTTSYIHVGRRTKHPHKIPKASAVRNTMANSSCPEMGRGLECGSTGGVCRCLYPVKAAYQWISFVPVFKQFSPVFARFHSIYSSFFLLVCLPILVGVFARLLVEVTSLALCHPSLLLPASALSCVPPTVFPYVSIVALARLHKFTYGGSTSHGHMAMQGYALQALVARLCTASARRLSSVPQPAMSQLAVSSVPHLAVSSLQALVACPRCVSRRFLFPPLGTSHPPVTVPPPSIYVESSSLSHDLLRRASADLTAFSEAKPRRRHLRSLISSIPTRSIFLYSDQWLNQNRLAAVVDLREANGGRKQTEPLIRIAAHR